MSDKKKPKGKKSKKPKKTQQQLDEERKQREADRARRDAERAKKRLSLRAKIANRKQETQKKKEEPKPCAKTEETVEKEQRKQILRYRRAQSRFALPKISHDDDINDIARANAELQAAIATQDEKTQESQEQLTINIIKDKNDTNDNDDEDEKREATPDIDAQSVSSFASLDELALSEEQEDALHSLTNELEAADPDFYGFVDYKQFISILKSNDIKLSAKHETFLMGALTLIDEGVDYYDFSRKIREVGMTLLPDYSLQDICEEIAENVEKERAKSAEPLPSTNLDDITSSDIVDVDQDEFEAFFKKAQQYRGRGMSLARIKSASADVNKSTKLGELIEDLALDGAEIDFALLKTALSTIDCHPPDKDLKYLINHVSSDGTGFVDFNYLITFLQETSGVPATKWRRIEKIIHKVVNQLKMVERAELRRQQQKEKLNARLEKTRNSRLPKTNETAEEMAKLAAEERRMRALKLRDKAKNVKK